MSSSCVTSTMVMPCSLLSAASSDMISWLLALSRLPVGSSAKMTAGLVTSARAMATRCCWPPESSDAVWFSRSDKPTSSSARRARRCRSAPRRAAIEQRQLEIFERGGALQQVEALEDEADVIAPDQRAGVAAERWRHRRHGRNSGRRSAYRDSQECSSRSTCPSPRARARRRTRRCRSQGRCRRAR